MTTVVDRETGEVIEIEERGLVIPRPAEIVSGGFAEYVREQLPRMTPEEVLGTKTQLEALEAFVESKSQLGEVQAAARRVEVRIGQLLGPGVQGQHTPAALSVVTERVTPDERYEFRQMAEHEDIVERVIAERKEAGRASRRRCLQEIAALREKPAPPVGEYSTIVIDPPWPMAKIERDVRPNQVAFDYEVMSEQELAALELPAAEGAHLYLWTTHKFLPMALRLAETWGFNYQCLMTWRKNVGFTPFSWMYSTEHVLFCTRGGLEVQRKGLRLDFEADVREHSRKPDAFYDLVRQASPGPRIDMFSREARDGFDTWGAGDGDFDG